MEAPLLLPISTAAGDDDEIVEAASPPPNTASTQSIVLRIAIVVAVACASLFAQHEASKGFAIDVVVGDTTSPAGRRFHLFFVSNGRAERAVHRASRGVERALFPDASFPRKRVTRVTVRLAGRNITADDATVEAGARGEYVISLSPGLVMSGNNNAAVAVAAAVRRAVARVWLWDGHGAATARVTESMVEYLAAGAEELLTPQQHEEEQCMSARFLRHLEQRRRGFVARLNRAMRDRWSDAAVDAALGAPARPVCAAYLAAAPPLAAADSTSSRGSSVAIS